MAVEQVFRIKFNGRTKPLDPKSVGECIVSEKFFIGSIEIDDITEQAEAGDGAYKGREHL